MKRIFLFLVAVLLVLPAFISTVVAEAAPQVSVAQRELKKDKEYRSSDIYARAHHIIYGSKAPLGPGGRIRIGIVINGDENMVVEDRVKNVIYQTIRKKFPREEFAVMKATDLNTELMQKAEAQYAQYKMRMENATSVGTVKPGATVVSSSAPNTAATVEKQDSLDADGMRVLDQPRGIVDLLCQDYVQAGRDCGYDYVLALTLSTGGVDVRPSNIPVIGNMFNNSIRANGWMRVRFVDVAGEKYLYRNDIATMGAIHNGFVNGRVYERSVRKAIKEAMNDIEVTED